MTGLEAAPAQSAGSALRRLRARFTTSLQSHLLLWVLGAYLLARGYSAVLVTWMAPHNAEIIVAYRDGATGPLGYWDVVHSWDGKWYEQILREGYPEQLPMNNDGTVEQNTWAFLPLFPAMTAGLMAVTGAPFGVAGSLLSLVAAGGAVMLMAVLLRERIGATGAFAATLLFSTAPSSPVLQMAYTESLGILLATIFLWAITRQRWAEACAAALLLGFERPIALSLVGVVIAVLVRMYLRRQVLRVRRRDVIGAICTLIATGLSGLAWPAVAAWRTGQLDAYTLTQSAWRAPGGVTPFEPWINNFQIFFGDGIGVVVLFVMVTCGFLLIAGPWSRGLGFVLRAWMVSYCCYLLAVVDVWTSTYRFLLFLWPVGAVLVGAAQRRAADRLLVGWRTAAFTLLFMAWQIWWVWELLRFVPPADNAI